jgi:hypothetical protein
VANAAPSPVTLSAATLALDTTTIGLTAPPQPILVTNTSGATLSITGITISGDYKQSNTCGSSLAAGASCVVNVSFTPSAPGTRSGTLKISDNATGSPQTVKLTGMATGSFVSLSAGPVKFPSTMPGTQSAPQSVTLTNSGNASVSITSITASGQFLYQPPATPAAGECGATLATGASCSIDYVVFAPTAAGTQTGALTITDSAENGSQSVSLSGSGADFTLPVTGDSSVTVARGQPATYTIAPAAVGAFTGTVAFICSGAPTEATCTVSPASVQIAASGTPTVTVSVTTTASSMLLPTGLSTGRQWPQPPLAAPGTLWLGLLVMALLATQVTARGRGRTWRLLAPVLMATLMASCGGGNPGTSSGTSTLTITGTYSQNSVTVTHTANLTLVVK